MPNDEIVNVRYMVDDVDESIAFYTKLLGFELLTSASPAFADVKRGNLRLLLSGPEELGGPADARRGASPDRAAGTASTSSSTTSTPRSPGSATPARTFRNDIVEGPGGKQILLLDPSGNVVELFQPAGR